MSDNIITMPQGQSYAKLAVEKIAEELKAFKGDRYGEAVKNHVASTLTHFCEQNERFAEVVYRTKRTLSDCCAEIMKGCGQSISDIDVYRGAVRHYFPNADIEFHMTISINGDAPTEEELNREAAVKKAAKPAKEKAVEKKPAKEKKAAPAAPVAPNPPVEKPKPASEKPAVKPKAERKKPAPHDDLEVIQLSLF